MPTIQTRELERLLEDRRYRRLIVKRIHGLYYLIVYDQEDRPLIHCNKDGRHKEYRHLEQPIEWLQQRFGLTNVIVEP